MILPVFFILNVMLRAREEVFMETGYCLLFKGKALNIKRLLTRTVSISVSLETELRVSVLSYISDIFLKICNRAF